ncbi:hypothetical protein HPB47_015138, partial [Ixodes persulcatus]
MVLVSELVSAVATGVLVSELVASAVDSGVDWEAATVGPALWVRWVSVEEAAQPGLEASPGHLAICPDSAVQATGRAWFTEDTAATKDGTESKNRYWGRRTHFNIGNCSSAPRFRFGAGAGPGPYRGRRRGIGQPSFVAMDLATANCPVPVWAALSKRSVLVTGCWLFGGQDWSPNGCFGHRW